MNEEQTLIEQMWREVHPDAGHIEVSPIRQGQYSVEVFDDQGQLVEFHMTLKGWINDPHLDGTLAERSVAPEVG